MSASSPHVERARRRRRRPRCRASPRTRRPDAPARRADQADGGPVKTTRRHHPRLQQREKVDRQSGEPARGEVSAKEAWLIAVILRASSDSQERRCRAGSLSSTCERPLRRLRSRWSSSPNGEWAAVIDQVLFGQSGTRCLTAFLGLAPRTSPRRAEYRSPVQIPRSASTRSSMRPTRPALRRCSARTVRRLKAGIALREALSFSP